MKDEEEFRTGIFSCGEKDYTFALKNFKFLYTKKLNCAKISLYSYKKR